MKALFLILISISITFRSQASFWYKDLEFISIENFSVDKGAENIIINFDYIIK